MEQINDGGPAFPQSETLYEDGAELCREAHGGMTLRDWFAGQALVGIGTWLPVTDWPATIAEQNAIRAQHAYSVADAMIAARGGQPHDD